MAMIKFSGQVNLKGFENYNYIVGQIFDRMKQNPEHQISMGIPPYAFKQAEQCKDKIKKSIIDGVKKQKHG